MKKKKKKKKKPGRVRHAARIPDARLDATRHPVLLNPGRIRRNPGHAREPARVRSSPEAPLDATRYPVLLNAARVREPVRVRGFLDATGCFVLRDVPGRGVAGSGFRVQGSRFSV